MQPSVWIGMVGSRLLGLVGIGVGMVLGPSGEVHAAEGAGWLSSMRFRATLEIETEAVLTSACPVQVDLDLKRAIGSLDLRGGLDPDLVEVWVSSALQADPGQATGESRAWPRRHLGSDGSWVEVPHRAEGCYGSARVTISFLLPTGSGRRAQVYFDRPDAPGGRSRRYGGLLGDGDFFRETWQRREIGASHFDQFVDLDGDGDLDLAKGGVEPFVYVFENVGGNRLVDRGRLGSGGQVLVLPRSESNRSWVTVAFQDWDHDGDPDLFPSFNDGPDRGGIVFYRNETRQKGGEMTFTRVGALQTIGGAAIPSDAQAGGWFPAATWVEDWDGAGDGGMDLIVGSNHRCWLYRGLGSEDRQVPRLAEPVAIRAGGEEIVLTNPRFDCVDLDGDGDLDLLAGTQPGAIHYFENTGTRSGPVFKRGRVVAYDGRYLIGDAHSGVKAADFTGDGRMDFVTGRFWQRADLLRVDEPREFGSLWVGGGARQTWDFERRDHRGGAPFVEGFLPCDAIRQNSVRAVDWDGDGRLDLLAGDTDGFIWFFRSAGEGRFRLFEPGRRLRAGQDWLSTAQGGGHARLAVSDWNNDGRMDLVVSDGHGSVWLYRNAGAEAGGQPRLGGAERLQAGGKPLQIGGRSSVLVCDWDADGHKDLVLADDKGYYVSRNVGQDDAPKLAPPEPILFGGRPVRYVRPNLGSFVDWDGDGKKDLVGCEFENRVRFYRNLGSGAPGEPPRFADPQGEIILDGSSPQMISGAEVVDWNDDGDLDLLTGQGHGGSGLRYYERDWLERTRRGRIPQVKVLAIETRK